MFSVDDLARRKLLVVAGKGGVGRSTVAAALARELAAPSRRVLLMEADPWESLHELLGVAPSGGEEIQVEETLSLLALKPRQVLDEVVRRQVGVALLANRILASPLYHHFTEGAPGLKELAVLHYARSRLEGKGDGGDAAVDLVVLEAPPTGHGVLLLTAPLVVQEVVQSGPFGRMAKGLAAFVSDPGVTAMVVVTLAEEMPMEEALDLRRTLGQALHRTAELLIVNRLYPPHPKPEEPEDVSDPLGTLWRRRRQNQERMLRRLDREWEGPRIELPFLPLEAGPDLTRALQESLRQASPKEGTS